MEKMSSEKIPAREQIKKMEQAEQDRRDKINAERKAENERIEAQSALRKELAQKSKELGVALAMPNAQLEGSIDGESYALDVRGRFCQQRGFMIEPFDWGKQPRTEEFKGKTRPFVSHESHGIQWHSDEEAVRAEMAAKFPDDPLYEKELEGEEMDKGSDGFYRGRKRIVKIIQNWEKMKDEEEAAAVPEQAEAA
jgi:hypothetical protein